MVNRMIVVFFVAAFSSFAAVTPQADSGGFVTLDFLLTVRGGQPPAGLQASDVRLKVGGKARPLLSLESIGPDDGVRHILLLVNEATLFGLEAVARDAITKLLDSLSPTDRVTYLGLRGQAPETGPESIRSALDAMRTGPGEQWTCASAMLRNIESAAGRLPPGRGSSIAVITRGALDNFDTVSSHSVGCTPGRQDLRHTQQVISSAQVNLHLFTVAHLNRSWGLDTVAVNTGGTFGLLSWADAGSLARAVSETRRFYRATIAADPAAPSLPQRVQLEVNHPKTKAITSPTLELRPHK